MAKSRTVTCGEPTTQISHDVAAEIAETLAEWYAGAQRDLNFRKSRDPYAIMVSEFMLQQTTVAAVEPYFARFMRRFPTVAVLAAASEDEVMGFWAGLGYYRRARQLRAAAIELLEKYQGVIPQDVKAMEKLPGFGRYTAGAVLSLAYEIPVPVLEANTIRVYSRLAGIEGVVGDSRFTRQLWSIGEGLVTSAASPRDLNLAAMELGALICRPRPKCDMCPAQHLCVAYRTERTEIIPQARPRRQKIAVAFACAAIRNKSGQYLIRRIPAGEWHSGLWEFPTMRIMDCNSPDRTIRDHIQALTENTPETLEELTALKYTVTHHEVTCTVFHCHVHIEKEKSAVGNGDFMLCTLEEISGLAMGSAQKKLFKLLLKKSAGGDI